MSFTLHPRLAADTHFICELELCQVLLMNDERYPWLILVPTVADLRDLHELDQDLHAMAFSEITRASKALQETFAPYKINVAALGNQVEQLHIHVIARSQDDAAWPGPVWGVGDAQPYAETNEIRTIESLRANLKTT